MSVRSSAAERRGQEYENAFNAFDEDEDGVIPFELLGKLLRACGFITSPEDVEDMIDELKSQEKALTLETFTDICSYHGRARDTAQEFVNAFRLFDRKGTGKLEVGLVRRILESFKHPLSPQGIDDLIGQVELDSQGCLDYRDFVKQLLDF